MHIIHHGRIFASILILIIAHSLCAQPYQVSPIEKNFADTIPIELYNNLIILPVAINEKDHRFIFDTGCTVSMISPEVLLPDYEVVRRDTISDVNGERKEMSFVKVCEVSIGKLHFPCYPMLSYSFKDMPWKCAQIDGVVGGDILQSLIVKIDTQHKRLILTDRKKWFKKEKGADGSMKIRRNRPFINLRIGRIVVKDVLFDAGKTDFFSLSEDIFRQLKSFKHTWWMGKTIEITKGATTLGFFGFATEDSVSLVKLPEWKLNGIPFKNVYTKTNTKSYCSIGAKLFTYGDIILNYPGKRFSFLPYNTGKSISTTEERRMNFGPENGRIVITLLFENSAYYQHGLRRGDRIIEINNREINDDFCILTEVLTEEIKQIKVIDKKGNEKEFHFP